MQSTEKVAKRYGMDCLFSKDYSHTFLGDAALVLHSSYYYQLRGGGMGVIPIFSEVPYEIVSALGNEVEWRKGALASWATPEQVFRVIPPDNQVLYLPSVPFSL